jgi:hypothetical protein
MLKCIGEIYLNVADKTPLFRAESSDIRREATGRLDFFGALNYIPRRCTEQKLENFSMFRAMGKGG